MRKYMIIAVCLYILAFLAGESIVIDFNEIGAVSASTVAEVEALLGESFFMSKEEAKASAANVKAAVEAMGQDVNVYWQVNPILSLLAFAFAIVGIVSRNKK